MKPLLNELISKARKLNEAGGSEEAMLLADDILQAYPNETKSWGLRAHLRILRGDFLSANSDLTTALAIEPTNPYFLFRRGLNYLELRDWNTAVEDFTKGLSLNDPAFQDSFYFARADAFIKLGRKEAALLDLVNVPDEFKMWTDRLRAKTDLLAECTKP